jgi:hypothetical protein
MGKQWAHVDHLSLPTTPAARMAALFTFRSAWDLVDLGPYMKLMTSHNETLEELVLRHASIVDGKVVATA